MNFWSSLHSCPQPTMSEQLASVEGKDLYVGFSKERGRGLCKDSFLCLHRWRFVFRQALWAHLNHAGRLSSEKLELDASRNAWPSICCQTFIIIFVSVVKHSLFSPFAKSLS